MVDNEAEAAGPVEQVIFLGAGASAADGAPLQGGIFRKYFTDLDMDDEWGNIVKTFFSEIFGISADVLDGSNPFPTFEEVLGLTEIAISQGESIGKYSSTFNYDIQEPPMLQNLHGILAFTIAQVLEMSLSSSSGEHHKALVSNLIKKKLLTKTAFISLNYDILVDNAIGASGQAVDYGIDFTPNEKTGQIKLYKPHGSLNWLYCPRCRSIRLTHGEKGGAWIKRQPEKCQCGQCRGMQESVIVPPTYFKVLSNLFLRQVWHAAEQALRGCKKIIFCGYSFPDADIYLRYLLKRAELANPHSPDIYIVNEHEKKEPSGKEEEEKRYRRFFREKSKIHWIALSFEQFCENPDAIGS